MANQPYYKQTFETLQTVRFLHVTREARDYAHDVFDTASADQSPSFTDTPNASRLEFALGDPTHEYERVVLNAVSNALIIALEQRHLMPPDESRHGDLPLPTRVTRKSLMLDPHHQVVRTGNEESCGIDDIQEFYDQFRRVVDVVGSKATGSLVLIKHSVE